MRMMTESVKAIIGEWYLRTNILVALIPERLFRKCLILVLHYTVPLICGHQWATDH